MTLTRLCRSRCDAAPALPSRLARPRRAPGRRTPHAGHQILQGAPALAHSADCALEVTLRRQALLPVRAGPRVGQG
eukprot:scaffold6352_cov200-Isochrysis_galbana.AAC.3